MKIEKDFKLRANLTNEFYKTKTELISCLTTRGAKAIQRKKICFIEQELSIDEYLEKKMSGYCHCALFNLNPKIKYKISRSGYRNEEWAYYQKNTATGTKGALKVDFTRNEFFGSTSIVTVDIDATRYTDIGEFLDRLELKPTIVYPSYNDNKLKRGVISRRFHMDYIFEHPLGEDEFEWVAPLVSKMVEISTREEIEDTCGERKSQFFCGVYGTEECYTTYKVYSIIDFSEYQLVDDEIIKEQTLEREERNGININYTMLRDMETMSYDEFMKNNRHKYKYSYRVDNDIWINGRYQFVEPGYFSLFWNKKRLKDGQNRRKKVYERMCLRRVINPDIDADTLIFCAYEDVHRFFDNSDKVFNAQYYEKNCQSVMKLSIGQIEMQFEDDLMYLRSRAPKRGIIYKSRKMGESRSVQHCKEDTFSVVDLYYKSDYDVNYNVEHINDVCGFPISKSVLYEYCQSRGIKNGRLSDEELIEIVDVELSVRENVSRLRELNYKVGKDRVSKVLRELKEESEEQNRCKKESSRWGEVVCLW